ncbi:hypothetical protein V8F33_010273 [Rhypophila sp. PSN 637]
MVCVSYIYLLQGVYNFFFSQSCVRDMDWEAISQGKGRCKIQVIRRGAEKVHGRCLMGSTVGEKGASRDQNGPEQENKMRLLIILTHTTCKYYRQQLQYDLPLFHLEVHASAFNPLLPGGFYLMLNLGDDPDAIPIHFTTMSARDESSSSSTGYKRMGSPKVDRCNRDGRLMSCLFGRRAFFGRRKPLQPPLSGGTHSPTPRSAIGQST